MRSRNDHERITPRHTRGVDPVPIPLDLINPDGSLKAIESITDVAALRLLSRGIRDGSGGARTLKMGTSFRRLKWLQEDPSLIWHAAYYLLGAARLYTDSVTG